MRSKSIFSVMMLLISIMVILLYSPIHAKEVRGVTDDTIKIGAILDMTGPFAADTGPEGYTGGVEFTLDI